MSIRELLQQMTLDEKIAQLGAYMFFDTFWNTHGSQELEERVSFIESITPEKMIPSHGLGFVSTQVRDLPPRQAAETVQKDQDYIQSHTRLKIPLIVHDEGVHGVIGNGTTVFPSALALSATWNEQLMFQVGTVIGKESHARGIQQLLSPTLNLGRDPRNGRTEETYGEDPLLAARMGVNFIKAVQAENVVCTPKHFVYNFEGDAGRDSWPVFPSERILREEYFVPFEAAIKEAGAMSLMAAYGSLNGKPCSGDEWLLKKVLREEWGFDGFVVSDYHSIIHQWELHKTATSMGDAAAQSLRAGMDVELPRLRCFLDPLKEELKDDPTLQVDIDRAVLSVLSIKEKLGLLDQKPQFDPEHAGKVCNCPKHRTLARQAARESMVLLTNYEQVLPIKNQYQKIAVIGPNADAIELGDYSWDLNDKEHVVTPWSGLREIAEKRGVELVYAPGGTHTQSTEAELEQARLMIEESDLSILMLGTSLSMTGEARDRFSLDLPDNQLELIDCAHLLDKPFVVVVVSSSIHTMESWIDKPDAILHAWYSGEEGGNALAELLFGDHSPSGRLPITVPRSIGQCPIHYMHLPSGRGDDYEKLGQSGGVRFPFGYGLSYTSFEYGGLQLEVDRKRHILEVSMELSNTGTYDSYETVQVYMAKEYSPLARPKRKLIGFEKVFLTKGEKKALKIQIPLDRLMFYNEQMEKVLEPGEYHIRVGQSSISTDSLEGALRIERE